MWRVQRAVAAASGVALRGHVRWMAAASGTGSGTGPKKVSSAMDLFDELESYEEKASAEKFKESLDKSAKEAGEKKRITAKEPQIRGSPRRLEIITEALRGKSYMELKDMLGKLRNTGARSAERAIDNARRRAVLQWDVKDDRRLIVEQAWVGKQDTSPRMVIHARGKTGVKHRRWGKMWVTMRYLSEDDDALTFSRVCAALEKHSVERHRVRYLLRYGPRTTMFAIAKEAGLTRQQGRAYLKMLSETNDEFRKPVYEKKAPAAAASAAPIPPSSASGSGAQQVYRKQ